MGELRRQVEAELLAAFRAEGRALDADAMRAIADEASQRVAARTSGDGGGGGAGTRRGATAAEEGDGEGEAGVSERRRQLEVEARAAKQKK